MVCLVESSYKANGNALTDKNEKKIINNKTQIKVGNMLLKATNKPIEIANPIIPQTAKTSILSWLTFLPKKKQNIAEANSINVAKTLPLIFTSNCPILSFKKLGINFSIKVV